MAHEHAICAAIHAAAEHGAYVKDAGEESALRHFQKLLPAAVERTLDRLRTALEAREAEAQRAVDHL